MKLIFYSTLSYVNVMIHIRQTDNVYQKISDAVVDVRFSLIM